VHKDKAEAYAMSLVHRSKELGESQWTEFWLHVAHAIDQMLNPKSKEQTY
jgi:hypothetical protein